MPAHARVRAAVLRWFAKLPRPRCSLQSLMLLVLLAGAAGILWLHRNPWYLERSFNVGQRLALVYKVSNDGHLLAVWTIGAPIRVFDLKTGAPVQALGDKENFVSAMAFSPDDRWLGRISDDSHTARVLDVQSGEVEFEQALTRIKMIPRRCMQEYSSYYPPGLNARFSMAGGRVITYSDLDNALLDIHDGTKIAGCPDNLKTFSPHGSMALFEASPGCWTAIRTATGDVAAEQSKLPEKQGIAVFLDEARCCVIDGRDGSVWFWNLETGKLQFRNAPNPGVASYAWAFGDDGRVLVHGHEQFWIWEFPKSGPVAEPELIPAPTFERHFPCRQSSRVLAFKLEPKDGQRASPKIYQLHPWQELAAIELPDQEFADGAEFIDEDSLLILTRNANALLYKRRMVEGPFALAWLPEFWLTMLFALLLLWSLWRDFRTLRKAAT